MEENDEIDKILLKMHYKARKQAIQELLEKYKNDKKMVEKLKEIRDNDSIKLT
jgi:hypothetical protein